MPGHNQRLRGSLTRSHRAGQMILAVQPISEPVMVSAADAADLLGPEWLAWVAPDVEIKRQVGERIVEVALSAFESEWGDL